MVTRVHNPETGFFEVKRSPLPSPTVSPVPGLHGTSRNIKPPLSTSRTDYKHKPFTNTETPHIPSSTHSKSRQIIDSTYSKYRPKSSEITIRNEKFKKSIFDESIKSFLQNGLAEWITLLLESVYVPSSTHMLGGHFFHV